MNNANESLVTGFLSMVGADADTTKAPDDYYGEDGLLYCGTCHKPKEKRRKLPPVIGGGSRVFLCMCDCQLKTYQEQEERRKKEKEMEKLKSLRRASLMDAVFEQSRFDKCRVTKDNKNPIKIAKHYAEHFAEMQEKNRGMILYGPPGTGKSHIAACVANALLDKGVPVIMTSFVKLNSLSSSSTWLDQEDVIRKMQNAKLLIIDDIGAERATDYSLERVYNLIDSRVRSQKPMILTTNMTMDKMLSHDDIRYWRIFDRIFQNCWPVQFTGPSFRIHDASKLFDEMNSFLAESEE